MQAEFFQPQNFSFKQVQVEMDFGLCLHLETDSVQFYCLVWCWIFYDTMSNLKIGIIGAGKMAGAIVKGWVTSGLVPAAQVGFIKQKYKANSGDML